MHTPLGVVSALSNSGQDICVEKKVLLANGPVALRRLRVDASRPEHIACSSAAHPGQEEAAAVNSPGRAEPASVKTSQ
jgi:hypothetical protein